MFSSRKYLTIDRVKYLFKEFICKMLADKDRKSIATQLAELVDLWRTVRFWPQNYFKYEGYKKGVSLDYIKKYLPGMLFSDLRADILNDQRYCIFADDKYVFHKKMMDADVLTPKLLGVYSSGLVNAQTYQEKSEGYVPADVFFEELKVDGIVVKPTIDSCQGQGVTVINIDHSRIDKFNIAGKFYNSAGFSRWLNSEFANSQLLIEEIICQHRKLSAIYSNSVNTVRVDSLKAPDGTIIINSAYLRVGRNGRKVDNWSGKQGGIGINIDIKTGKSLGSGIDYSLNRFVKHPDTNHDLSEIQIPFWGEIISLVKKGANNLPNLNSLGWDIAITENGPLAVEVNADYDILAQQTCTQPFGSNNEYMKALIEYIKKSNFREKYIKHFNYFC